MDLEVVIPFLNWSSHPQCNLPNIKVGGKPGEAHNIEVVAAAYGHPTLLVVTSMMAMISSHLNSMHFYSIQILDHLVHLHSLLWGVIAAC